MKSVTTSSSFSIKNVPQLFDAPTAGLSKAQLKNQGIITSTFIEEGTKTVKIAGKANALPALLTMVAPYYGTVARVIHGGWTASNAGNA